MKLITLDMETFYDGDYSLSKLTTEEYVNDPRFEVIGIGVKVGDQPAEWASGSHEAMQKWLDTFDWSDAAVLCHNTMFDGAILAWKFGVKPKAWFDTLCMGRALHGVEASASLSALAFRYGIGAKGTEVLAAKGKRRVDFTEEELARYGDYCINDVELTYTLFRQMMKKFPPKELRVIDLTLRMFIEPRLHLDVPLLESHLADVKERKESLLASSGADKDDLMSNPKFAALLEGLGVRAPTKVSLTTGKETLALAKNDEGFKALAEHPDVRVQALVAARLGTKSTLEETRTERFIGIAKRMEAFPIPLRYCAAHTTRWGGCLVADTAVLVYDPKRGVTEKQIVDVLPDDLVWDGEEFVQHEGVQFSGFQEVVTWDGVTGTEDHVVFTDAGEISLRAAMQGGHRIQTARSPAENDVDAARELVRRNSQQDPV